jgi:hypothetical protein
LTYNEAVVKSVVVADMYYDYGSPPSLRVVEY